MLVTQDMRESLSDRNKRRCQFRGEPLEFGHALWRCWHAVLLPHKILAIPLLDAHTKIFAHHISRCAKNSEAVGSERRQQRRAVPFPHPNIVCIHRKRHNLELLRDKPLQYLRLLTTQIHVSRLSTPVFQANPVGFAAVLQNDFAKGEKLLFQAVDINRKFFGEDNDRTADSLRVAADLLVYEKKFAEAEPYLLRSVHVDEALYGSDNIGMVSPLTSLCNLYDRWDKAKESEACERHLLTVLEKQYGENSPVIVEVLVSDAKALREMGRTADAEKVDQRAASIRAATMKPN